MVKEYLDLSGSDCEKLFKLTPDRTNELYAYFESCESVVINNIAEYGNAKFENGKMVISIYPGKCLSLLLTSCASENEQLLAIFALPIFLDRVIGAISGIHIRNIDNFINEILS